MLASIVARGYVVALQALHATIDFFDRMLSAQARRNAIAALQHSGFRTSK